MIFCREVVNSPNQDEIDEGYIYGRDFSFIMDTNHVKPLTDGFTNQRVLNIEDATKMYKALQGKHIVDSSWIHYVQAFINIQMKIQMKPNDSRA